MRCNKWILFFLKMSQGKFSARQESKHITKVHNKLQDVFFVKICIVKLMCSFLQFFNFQFFVVKSINLKLRINREYFIHKECTQHCIKHAHQVLEFWNIYWYCVVPNTFRMQNNLLLKKKFNFKIRFLNSNTTFLLRDI